MTPRISKVQQHHPIGEICRIINAAYKRAPWLKSDAQRLCQDEIIEIIRNPGKEMYYCHAGDKVLGSVLLDGTAGFLEMAALAVSPDHQKQGIGEQLMSHAEQEARQRWRHSDLFIHVVPFMQERLIEFYLKHGYRTTEHPAQPFCALEMVKPEFIDKLKMYKMKKRILAPGANPAR